MSTALRQFTDYPPLSLYVHFPWCERKCPYCDFNSHTLRDDLPEQQYIDALISDLELHAPDIWGRPVDSIFIGGGTPSLISEAGMDRLLAAIRALTRLQPAAEITLEANPGSAEQQRFAGYRQSGINRLSIGVQSFSEHCLRALGRIHDSPAAERACNAARDAGFDNFNIDLMHGLPGQTLADASRDLQTAIAMQPTHLSYYQLTIEPNTLFASQPPTLPLDDTLWDIQEQGRMLMAEAGYSQYEVSAYTKDGFNCTHNLNYWLFGDYLGVGAGAHSKLTFSADASIVRMSKQRHPASYMQAAGSEDRIQSRDPLSTNDSRLEFMMNALRLNDGFANELFHSRTGEPLGVLNKVLERAESDGLIEHDFRRTRASELGQRHLNTLLELFMPADSEPDRPPAKRTGVSALNRIER